MIREAKGNMYSWITHTWNPIKGECPHGCTYCYMKRWGKQKPVRFDEKELKTDLGSGNFIFVGSSCDMFAKDIPEEWIIKTLDHCGQFDNHYLFQTKNPLSIINYESDFPENSVICTTIETNRFYPEFMVNSPTPELRAVQMHYLDEWNKYVTIEPIMDFDLEKLIMYIRWCNPKQVNIGADSGQIIDGKLQFILPEPPKEKILALIDELKKFTVIDQKRNLTRLLK